MVSMSSRPATTFSLEKPSLPTDHLYVSWLSANRLVEAPHLAFGINAKPFQALARAGFGPTHLIFGDEAARESVAYPVSSQPGVTVNARHDGSLKRAVTTTIRQPDEQFTTLPYLEIQIDTDSIHKVAKRLQPYYERVSQGYPYETSTVEVANLLVKDGLIHAIRSRQNKTPGRKIFRTVRAASISMPVALAASGAPSAEVVATAFLSGLATLATWGLTRSSSQDVTAANMQRNPIRVVRESQPFGLSLREN